MIVGASKICYYLASELLDMGMSVKIIDQNEQRCVPMSERLPKALVIVGDGTDSELLQEKRASARPTPSWPSPAWTRPTSSWP